MSLDPAHALERQLAFTHEFLRWLGGASEGASTVDAPGLTAAISAAPDRSIVNSVVFDTPSALEGAYNEVSAAYRDVGIEAWMVWVTEAGAAMVEARERGMRTSSLQASAMGSPIYERLGYEPYFRFHLLERRESPK